MTGADIIGALLMEDEDIVAFAAAGAIKAGRLPANVGLPAILVHVVSSIDRQPLKRGGRTHRTDRVGVLIRAANYRDQKRGIELVRIACPGVRTSVGGALRVAVLTAGSGPDVQGPGDTFERTQDFRVSFDAAD